jgi:hypothetical protein
MKRGQLSVSPQITKKQHLLDGHHRGQDRLMTKPRDVRIRFTSSPRYTEFAPALEDSDVALDIARDLKEDNPVADSRNVRRVMEALKTRRKTSPVR